MAGPVTPGRPLVCELLEVLCCVPFLCASLICTMEAIPWLACVRFFGGQGGVRGEGNFLNKNKMEIKKLDIEKQ